MSSLEGGDAPVVSERLPTVGGERLFATFGSFFATLTTLAAAIWIILVGGALPLVGDTRLGIIGYACGMVLGVALVVVSVALPAMRYGVDSVDISKLTLGIRGANLALGGLLVSALGWAGVAVAMVSRGAATLLGSLRVEPAPGSEKFILFTALLLLVLVLLLVRHGLDAIRRINDFAGPGFIFVSLVSLLLLLHRYGLHDLLLTNVPAAQALTADRLKSFAYAIEFGVTLSMAWWPYVGGLYRFLGRRRHAVGAIMFGGSLVGNAFSAAVAALAAVHVGTSDPAVWLVEIAGRFAGSILVIFVLLLSVPAICLMVYFVAGSAQQLRWLARTPWQWLVVLSIAPLTLVAPNTEWTLSHVVTIASFGSLVFFSICGISLVDFWILRKGRMELGQLYVGGAAGQYWYWGGVNWVAMLVIALGCGGYLYLYDPVTLEARESFRYFGAALPTILASGLLYFLLMKIRERLAGRLPEASGAAKEMPAPVGL